MLLSFVILSKFCEYITSNISKIILIIFLLKSLSVSAGKNNYLRAHNIFFRQLRYPNNCYLRAIYSSIYILRTTSFSDNCDNIIFCVFVRKNTQLYDKKFVSIVPPDIICASDTTSYVMSTHTLMYMGHLQAS